LQNAWDYYGKDVFEFSIVEECAREDLIKREQRYLDELTPWDRTIGYNVSKSASGDTHSDETKEKLKNIFYGEGSNTAILTREDVVEICKEYINSNCTQKYLAEKYGVSTGVIVDIFNGRTWQKEECVKEVNKLKKRKQWKLRGEGQHLAKLTWEKVKEIRKRYEEEKELSQLQLSKDYDVNFKTMWMILRNKTWVDLDYIPLLVKRPKFKINLLK
jgi:group I intron endonuclease